MKSKAIIKAKKYDNIVRVKIRIPHPMLTKRQASMKGIRQDYITHIFATVNKRIVFDFRPTQSVSKYPTFKFAFKANGVKAGDILVLTWQTLLGETKHTSYAIQENDT